MRGLISTLAVLAVTFTAVQTDSNARVVCYFSSWAVYRPNVGSYDIKDIPVGKCTHVIYAFVGITDETNKIVSLDYERDITKRGFRKFTSLRSKYPDVKFMVGLGGWSEGGYKYSNMVADSSSRQIFTESAVNFLNKFAFDGMDVDWEFPGALDRNGTDDDKNNLIYLLQELRAAFDEVGKNWELTATIPLSESKLDDGYDVSKICRICNAVHVSAYDLRGPWGNFVDVQSPLYSRSNEEPGYGSINVDNGLSLLQDLGCPAHKLVVGIAFYGRTFTLNRGTRSFDVGTKFNTTAGGGTPGPYTKSKGTLSYYEICSVVDSKDSAWTKKWAKDGMCPYAHNNDMWIGYEDRKSVEIKMNWIKKKEYLGAMVWSIDMDDFRGLCGEKNPLLNVLYEYMNNYRVPSPNQYMSNDRVPSQNEYTSNSGVPSPNEYMSNDRVPSQNEYTSNSGVPSQNEYTSNSGVPSPNEYMSNDRVPSQNEYTSNSGVPSQNEYTSNSGVPSPNEYMSNDRVPSQNEYTSNSGVPSPNEYTSNSRVPLPNEYMSNSRVPSPNGYMSNDRVPPLNEYMSNSRVPPANEYMSNSRVPSPMTPITGTPTDDTETSIASQPSFRRGASGVNNNDPLPFSGPFTPEMLNSGQQKLTRNKPQGNLLYTRRNF